VALALPGDLVSRVGSWPVRSRRFDGVWALAKELAWLNWWLKEVPGEPPAG
jgi:hypothetical protein